MNVALADTKQHMTHLSILFHHRHNGLKGVVFRFVGVFFQLCEVLDFILLHPFVIAAYRLLLSYDTHTHTHTHTPPPPHTHTETAEMRNNSGQSERWRSSNLPQCECGVNQPKVQQTLCRSAALHKRVSEQTYGFASAHALAHRHIKCLLASATKHSVTHTCTERRRWERAGGSGGL
jgi:hypothetical protein